MKKIAVIIVVALSLALIGTGCARNQRNLQKMSARFVGTVSKYATADVIEVRNVYGKLIGNGNGIQYFGAALLEKGAITDPDALLAELGTEFEVVGILDQVGNRVDVKYLEHQSLYYNASALESGKEYVTVYFFNSWYEGSNEFDIMGH